MLNPIEEKKFAELKDKCRELKMPPPPDTYVKLKVVNADGKVAFDDIQRAHSWTRNFYNNLYSYPLYAGAGTSSYAAGSFSIRCTNGSIRQVWSEYGAAPMKSASAGNDQYGLVIGTGDTASSMADYAMAAQIKHGTSSGQMSHQESNGPAANYTGATKIWDLTYYRIFNNNSGASITVKECGFISDPSSMTYFILLERTVLSPTVVVADGAQLTVTYVVTLDFSAID